MILRENKGILKAREQNFHKKNYSFRSISILIMPIFPQNYSFLTNYHQASRLPADTVWPLTNDIMRQIIGQDLCR